MIGKDKSKVVCYMPNELIFKLDEASASVGVSRSTIIVLLLQDALKKLKNLDGGETPRCGK